MKLISILFITLVLNAKMPIDKWHIKHLERCIKHFNSKVNNLSEFELNWIYSESSCNFKLKKHKHSSVYGILQLMPKTAKWICEKKLKEIFDKKKFKSSLKYQLYLARAYLRYLYIKSDYDLRMALGSYNQGYKGLRNSSKRMNKGLRYADKILNNYIEDVYQIVTNR